MMNNNEKVYILFPGLLKVIRAFQAQVNKELPEEDARLKLNQVVSKMSLFYEKIRNVVDYAEEHLLRERAIKRTLKRTMTLYNRSGAIIAKPLIFDMIRSGYLPNDKLSENLIPQTEIVIDRYISLIDILANYQEREYKIKFFEWLNDMLAIELDDLFIDKNHDDSLIECMYQVVSRDVKVANNSWSAFEIKIQLYVAILRSLMKADRSRISFYLWLFFVPHWQSAGREDVIKIAQGIEGIYQQIDKNLNHPLSDLYQRVLKRYNVIFLIIRDIISSDPNGALDIWTQPSFLEEKIRTAAKRRYKDSRVKLRRSIVRSIIYLFITKTIMAVLLEFPLDLMLEKQVNYVSLAINVLFPPLLMFLIGLFIRVPGIKNTDRIVHGIKEISYQFDERKIIQKIKRPLKRGIMMTRVFRVIYTAVFALTFGLIIYGLHWIDFNIASMVIFIFFLSLVSFFSIRISQSARELHIIQRKENIFSFFKDFFSLPILHFGRWLNSHLSKINFFIILFDFVIEAPFKVLINAIDEWTSYVAEKKEELY